MKTTNEMNRGGKLKKEYYELWSRYFVKFIEEYKKNGFKMKHLGDFDLTLEEKPED